MRFCTKCGTQLRDEAKFCPKCGAPARALSAAAPKPVPETQPAQQLKPDAQKIGKTGKKAFLLIAAGIIAAAAVLAVVGIFAVKKLSSPDVTEAAKKSETETAQEAETESAEPVEKTEAETVQPETETEAETVQPETETEPEPVPVQPTEESVPESENGNGIAEDTENRLNDFVSGWWSNGSQRSYYYAEKLDEDHLTVFYHENRMGYPCYFEYDGEGIGTLRGKELHVNMYYTYRMSDIYGNTAERRTGPYDEVWQLVSDLPEDYCLRPDEQIFTDTGYPAPESIRDCKPEDHCVVFRAYDGKDFSPEEREIIWYSSEVCIDPGSIAGLEKNQLRIARNEIYARHGRKFSSADLQSYFDGCSWYHGYIEPSAFDENSLSEVEKYNVALIGQLEDGKSPDVSFRGSNR